MRLATILKDEFPPDVRSRGAEYFSRGAVRKTNGSETEFSARVQGSRQYEVDLDWNGEGLTMWCDCPYYDSNGPCKHLWAAILAADAFGYMGDVKMEPLNGPFHSEDLRPVPVPPRPVAPKQPTWRQRVDEIGAARGARREVWPADRQLLYIVDLSTGSNIGVLSLGLFTREPKRSGGWKKLVEARLTRSTLPLLPDADRHILGLLTGVQSSYWTPDSYVPLSPAYRLLAPLAGIVMPLIVATGRCMLARDLLKRDLIPARWDEGEPWGFQLRFTRVEGKCRLTGFLRRGDEEMDVAAPALITESGFVFNGDRISRLNENASFPWIQYLRKGGDIEAPEKEADQLLGAALEHPSKLPIEVPEDLRYEEIRIAPRPRLTIRTAKRYYSQERLRAQLSFDYDGRQVAESAASGGLYDHEGRKLIVRDRAAEEAARNRLVELGLSGPTQDWNDTEPAWDLAPKKLPAVVHACLESGWHIEAEGKVFRRPGGVRVEVSSGIDWFEMHGEVSYGDTSAKLPALLAALRRGEKMVRLDDGTFGLLPEEWLSRLGPLAALGISATDHVRFRRNQAGLLDALLAAQPEIRCDESFERVRAELRSFEGIGAAEQPAGFAGRLRDYQRDGVGWMEFLRRFGFGGCLADDMGVGKTAQVLALLESRRNGGQSHEAAHAPSLVVVPKSLVFNWKQEAARFTPQLRVLDHTGMARNVNGFADYDVVLTTYGTLRRDAANLKDIEFDYVVLDEAQAIKNPDTESAKAVRLLRGRNRLALSGTPVENHLGELWSLFEFLNPGMLGAASVFKLAGGAARNPSPETRKLLAQALRPFLLRRTKEQVACELPAKLEQTLYCELDAPQRKLYNELRAHYRNSLLHRVEKEGLAKSKIQVLEALLRLRQAACHPGLLDAKRLRDASAKTEMLMARLREVVDEGHKALVFSQFTSLLSIVRAQLDEAGIAYEYLDGATRDRQSRVERFQNDPDCRLFLISLKAGGLGLNLTAAEYVFLLDPWWNPAVEAQAVDRAHRIGQTRQVFAYRLIARDTVEEKVLELQNSKRDLAAAIITQDNSLIRNLQREDLELLLS